MFLPKVEKITLNNAEVIKKTEGLKVSIPLHTILFGTACFIVTLAVFEPECELATFSPLSDDLSIKI